MVGGEECNYYYSEYSSTTVVSPLTLSFFLFFLSCIGSNKDNGSQNHRKSNSKNLILRSFFIFGVFLSLAIEDFIIIYLTCLTRSDQADQTDPLTTWLTTWPTDNSKELKSRNCQILIDHWQILDFSSFKTKTKNKNKLMQKCFFYLVWYLCFLIRNLYKKK